MCEHLVVLLENYNCFLHNFRIQVWTLSSYFWNQKSAVLSLDFTISKICIANLLYILLLWSLSSHVSSLKNSAPKTWMVIEIFDYINTDFFFFNAKLRVFCVSSLCLVFWVLCESMFQSSHWTNLSIP